MITSLDLKLLAALDEDGGFTTGQVAARSGLSYGGNKRQRSGAVRAWLMKLKGDGLVTFLDDHKPVCWVRTAAGTAIVESEAS